jgi:hypothetical protein
MNPLMRILFLSPALVFVGCSTVPESVQELRAAEREAQLTRMALAVDAREKPVASLVWSLPPGTVLEIPEDAGPMVFSHEVRESVAGTLAAAEGGAGSGYSPIPENPALTAAKILAPLGLSFITGYWNDQALGKVVGLGSSAISANTDIASAGLAKEPTIVPAPEAPAVP